MPSRRRRERCAAILPGDIVTSMDSIWCAGRHTDDPSAPLDTHYRTATGGFHEAGFVQNTPRSRSVSPHGVLRAGLLI